MYCPSCGTESNDLTKYCTKCGLNLRRVKGLLGKGGAGVLEGNYREQARLALLEVRRDKIEEQKKRANERRKKTPAEKRLNEIKAGVIVSSLGISLMLFLSLLFDAIASTMAGPEANILRALWAVGLVPFMAGIGILLNGFFVSKRIVELKRQEDQTADQQSFIFSAPNTSPVMQLVEPSQPTISDFSVTETTTTKLREPVSAPSPRDTN
ncbi:MAG: zinc ribbon domain-containing protein [Chloracidobacterium sp.]|nr:zinc ribbon domain-containing protein [Chloracidobacterium sp.]